MSYCRMSPDCDVYLFPGESAWICQGCRLPGTALEVELASLVEARNHLLEHRKAGHKVPQYAFDRLDEEIREGTG